MYFEPPSAPQVGGVTEIEDQRGREDESDEEEREASNRLNAYVVDPNIIHPQSPYEAVLASEPDLDKRPARSALKKAPGAPPTPGMWIKQFLNFLFLFWKSALWPMMVGGDLFMY